MKNKTGGQPPQEEQQAPFELPEMVFTSLLMGVGDFFDLITKPLFPLPVIGQVAVFLSIMFSIITGIGVVFWFFMKGEKGSALTFIVSTIVDILIPVQTISLGAIFIFKNKFVQKVAKEAAGVALAAVGTAVAPGAGTAAGAAIGGTAARTAGSVAVKAGTKAAGAAAQRGASAAARGAATTAERQISRTGGRAAEEIFEQPIARLKREYLEKSPVERLQERIRKMEDIKMPREQPREEDERDTDEDENEFRNVDEWPLAT